MVTKSRRRNRTGPTASPPGSEDDYSDYSASGGKDYPKQMLPIRAICKPNCQLAMMGPESVIEKMSYNYKMLLQQLPVTTTITTFTTTTSQSPSRAPPFGARPAARRRRRYQWSSPARLAVVALWPMVLLAIYTTSCLYLQQATIPLLAEAAASGGSGGVAPTIDYSHNMRVLKLPKSTKPGEIIYRLRGSDGDPNSQLHFGVAGIAGRSLLDIVQVPGSWNEADVYLRSRLDSSADLATTGSEQLSPDQASSTSLANINHHNQLLGDPITGAASSQEQPLYAAIHNLTIYVADATNKTTQVDSTILVTNDELLDDPDVDSSGSGSLETSGYETSGANDSEQRKYQQLGGLASSSLVPESSSNQHHHLQHHHNHQANGSSLLMKLPTLPTMTRVNSLQLSPFIRPRYVFWVPENGRPGESIGFLTVRESDKSDLPVRFELRGRGSDHFGIRYVFGPRGQSRAELVLSQPVDYEKQNLFQLKVLALNAWTNVKYDTRNVATLDIVITVGDVQDTPPQFKQLPHALRLTNNLRPGDLVGRVQAEDGDYADQRPIGYALDAGSPLSGYFTIDKLTGEIRLLRPLQELSLNQQNLASSGAGLGNDPTSGSLLELTVYASELPDASSYDHLWPPMFARAELPLLMVDLTNEPPQFIGGWLTETGGGTGAASLTVPTLRAFVREFGNDLATSGRADASSAEADVTYNGAGTGGLDGGAPPRHLVQWYTSKNHSTGAAVSGSSLGADPATLTNSPPSFQDSILALQQQLLKASRGRPMVVDFGQGLNGTFELSLEGPDAHLFELEPSGYPVSKQSLFNLFVAPNANRSQFDFDAIMSTRTSGPGGLAASVGTSAEPPARSFHVELVARDFGSPHRMATRLKCLIDLVDINDNAPQFDQPLYIFSIFENAQLGQIVGSIRARDMDRLAGIGGVLSGQQQRVRYTSLTGRDSHLFRLDQESGLITLEGALDREKQDQYLLLAEARDMSGQAANYTKILVNVLDVNDNAPVFSQAHYDAVLLADGTFYQPLVVSATDADEPSSANSQVAYEIIAGNQNDQFAIDSLSGAIFATGSAGASPSGGSLPPSSRPIQIPSILSEPILPFTRGGGDHNKQPDQHGKILPSPHAPGHEIEETTAPTGRYQLPYQQPSSPLRLNWPRSVPPATSLSASDGSISGSHGGPIEHGPEARRGRNGRVGGLDHSHLDLLQQETRESFESAAASLTAGRHRVRAVEAAATASPSQLSPSQQQPARVPPLQTAQSQRGHFHPPGGLDPRNYQLGNNNHQQQQQHFDPSKVPPVTTLVVRAHDFGIPLRSATSKVNIYNQALLSRSLSVILNGTAEQLEQRRELIERSFGALTGSRAHIESIDALSDSSSISVARLKLAIPAGHSLIDLTDLSALMTAIDYKPPAGSSNCPPLQQQQHLQNNNLDQFRHPIHYITTGDRIYPIHHAPISSNISATSSSLGGVGGSASPSGTSTAIFTDIQSFDHASNMLERKLLFYIIIVGICILALLVMWMIYFCCREDQQQQQQQRRINKTLDVSSASGKRGNHHQQHKRQKDSVDDSDLSREAPSSNAQLKGLKGRHHNKNKSSSRTHLIDEQQSMAKSASQLNLVDQQQLDTNSQQQQASNKTQAKTTMGTQHPIGNNLLKQQQHHQLSIPSNIKPEHYSMYNGQVWFEQGGLVRPPNGLMGSGGLQRQRGSPAATLGERRASSAPSAGGHSLDSGLHAIINGGGGGRSSAFSPANSGLTTPQRGQFFPNTLGYAENLATIGGGGAGLYPTSGRGGVTAAAAGPRQRQSFLGGRRTLVKSRGRVVPMAVLAPGVDYTNEAFEPDLESGGFGVMMPFVGPAGSGSHTTRRGSHSKGDRDHHHQHSRRHHNKSKQAHSTSSSSASRSDSTRTLDEEEELDHESVLLDSDQELLGFDSTGTPIIATRTRHKPTGGGITDTSLLLAPELGSGALGASTSAAAGASTSPAATVIDMSQTTARRTPTTKETGGEIRGGDHQRAEQQAPETAKKADSAEDETQNKREPQGDKQEPGNEAEQTVSGQANASAASRKDGTTKKTGDQTTTTTTKKDLETGSAKTTTLGAKREATIDSGAPVGTSGAPKGRQSLDLMSELNARLNSANKQRALRRQSADDKLDESQQQQQGQKQVSDQQHRTGVDGSDVAARTDARKRSDKSEPSELPRLVKGADTKAAPIEDTNTSSKPTMETAATANDDDSKRRQAFAKRRASETMSCQSQSTISEDTTTNTTMEGGGDNENRLRDMKNSELLEKQSIFALTYSGLATDKLPS